MPLKKFLERLNTKILKTKILSPSLNRGYTVSCFVVLNCNFSILKYQLKLQDLISLSPTPSLPLVQKYRIKKNH